MDFARRVTTFDIAHGASETYDASEEDDLAVGDIEKEYLMGGGRRAAEEYQRVDPASAHLPHNDEFFQNLFSKSPKDNTATKIVLVGTLIAMGVAGVLLHFALVALVNSTFPASQLYNETFYSLCLAFGMEVAGVVSFVGLWRLRSKEKVPLFLAHVANVLFYFGLTAVGCLLMLRWPTIAGPPMHDDSGASTGSANAGSSEMQSLQQMLGYLGGCLGAILVWVYGNLTVRWSGSGMYSVTLGLVCFIQLCAAAAIGTLSVLAVQQSSGLGTLANWPVYGTVGYAALLLVLAVYGLTVGGVTHRRYASTNGSNLPDGANGAAALTSYLVLSVLVMAASSTIELVFNMILSQAAASASHLLLISSLTGFASQSVLLLGFVVVWVWRQRIVNPV